VIEFGLGWQDSREARSSRVGAVSDLLPDPISNPDVVAEVRSTPYARELVTHWNQDHIDRVIQVVENMGAADWLKANPLTRLEFEREVVLDGISMNGVYSFTDRVLQIATSRDRDLGEFGKDFIWNQVHSVSVTGQTPTESIQRTLVHELGHHVHNILGEVDLAEFNKTIRVNWLRGGTVYARTSYQEYFAETFAMYVFHNAMGASQNWGL
jgi:hypothetical protein